MLCWLLRFVGVSLRTTLQWSYDLLSAEEQRLFRLLASFVGGCTLRPLEAVYAMVVGENGPMVDQIGSLLNKHLLYQQEQEQGERRLLMLETIREYGWERLEVSDELEEVEQAGYELMKEKVRRQLGERTFAEALAQGCTLALEEILAWHKSPAADQSVVPARKRAGANKDRPVVVSASSQDLTLREIEVLRLVAEGLTDAQIAEELVISARTVHAHLRTIYRKLGISSRFAAIHYALDAYLI
jgi:DNA-binding CsgD family transcriptional regulator